MKIVLHKHKDGIEKEIIELDYQYLEGGSTDNNPSFHIAAGNNGNYFEIYFYTKDEEELKELIKNLQEIKDNFAKE